MSRRLNLRPSRLRCFSPKTSTTFGQARYKGPTTDRLLSTAIASADKIGFLLTNSVRHSEQTTETMADEIHPQPGLMIGATIVHLLLHSRPATIGRFVVAVCIDAVQRVFWRAWSHVREERGEIVHPPFADRNSSATVVLVFVVARIQTATFHLDPRSIFAGHLSIRGGAVFHGVS